jgi:hypothetical protein
MQTVSRSKVVTAQEAVDEPLPPRIQEALGQLVGAAKEGLLARDARADRALASRRIGWGLAHRAKAFRRARFPASR